MRDAQMMHELFEAQAARTPTSVALVQDDLELSYGELDRRANGLAHRLRAVGIGPDVPVAVSAEPSFDLLIALLGVLKAGGAYVPVDPATPAERFEFILSDTRTPILLTTRDLANRWQDLPVRRVVIDAAHSGADANWRPGHGANADHLAYIIYTSGSTGTPKGVMIPHRSICNTLFWRQSTFPLGADDRVLQTFSFTFDASVWELFAPLLAGARLVLTGPGIARDSRRVVETIARYRVTAIQAVPSTLRLLLEEEGLERCRSLRHVFCGGETLTGDLQKRFYSRLGAALHNMYGPTETALDATFWSCRPGEDRAAVPIGRAIANKRLYVLDRHLRPVPVRAPGELYIGGAGLARGYLSNPGLTAERFLPDPFAPEPGARMYRTGDLCRWLPDAALEFLGRIDYQVKVRGFRIEPGEIESALAAHPALREAVVIAREDRPGEPRLVAYVVLAAGHELDPAELRRFLRNRLPEYMVPSAFVGLPDLPRTAGGKVNRRAFPAPAAPRGAGAPPSDSMERFLAGLWGDVLGAEDVRRQDNFFDLGGTSLQAAVLIHKLQELLGEYVYMVALYDAPTLAGLADYLRANYPAAVGRLFGLGATPILTGSPAPVDEADVATLRRQLRRLPPRASGNGKRKPKNPRAVFVLSPPRSGSTLFRVLLGGHPALFAPPELQLLNFDTLRERRAAFDTDRDRFWLDGTIRALMEARQCSADEAARIMADCEGRALTVKDFYRLLQDDVSPARFVDKTPTYALDPEALNRAEEDFEDALYVHLIRHPAAVVSSFEEAKLHVFFPPFFRSPHQFSVWQLAELIWTVSHQNILAFLEHVPAHRRHVVRFEQLVQRPREIMGGVARFLGTPFHPAMTDPFRQNHKSRMTDGLRPHDRMLGDVKFHEHKGIEAEFAERPKGRYPEEALGEVTRRLARTLGYSMGTGGATSPAKRTGQAPPTRPAPAAPPAMIRLQAAGSGRPICWVHPASGDVTCYRELAAALGTDQPFLAWQAPYLVNRDWSPRSIEDMAAAYIRELRAVQGGGPYRLGGWSLGGVVAFEMARQLAGQGQAVSMLVLLDSDIPGADQPRPEPGLQQFLGEFARLHRLDVEPQLVARLGPRQALVHLAAQARQAALLPPFPRPGPLRRFLLRLARVFLANLRALRCYRPAPLPDGAQPGTILLLRPEDHAGAIPIGPGTGPMVSWATLAGDVVYRTNPGDHYSVLREPNVRALARQIKEFLR